MVVARLGAKVVESEGPKRTLECARDGQCISAQLILGKENVTKIEPLLT